MEESFQKIQKLRFSVTTCVRQVSKLSYMTVISPTFTAQKIKIQVSKSFSKMGFFRLNSELVIGLKESIKRKIEKVQEKVRKQYHKSFECSSFLPNYETRTPSHNLHCCLYNKKCDIPT